jgi:hypothetical protein
MAPENFIIRLDDENFYTVMRDGFPTARHSRATALTCHIWSPMKSAVVFA